VTAHAATRRPRSPRGEGNSLRADILDAAERLLVDLGNDEGVSIRAIAEAVGVTPPSIYRHFEDKEELLYQVCERRFADFNEAMRTADGEGDPVDSLRAMGAAYIRFALSHPEHYRVLMMTSRERDIHRTDSQGKRAFDHLVEATQRCIDAGRFRNDDAVRTAVSLWAGVHGLCSLLISTKGFPWPDPPEKLGENLLDLQLNGLLRAA
jgi:AcrR family transcriptional regulator